MQNLLTITILTIIVVCAATLVSSAPAYVRVARNATYEEPECVTFPTTWASCCDIQRNMTATSVITSTVTPTHSSSTATSQSYPEATSKATPKATPQATPNATAASTNTAMNSSDNSIVAIVTGSSSTITNSTESGHSTSDVTDRSGVYNLGHYGPFSATYGYCDLSTDGGGWLVIFRRNSDCDLEFNKSLKEYEDGFGTLEEGRSFWYGLKAINHITSRDIWELRVDLFSSNGEQIHAHYSNVSIGDARQGYTLQLGPYVAEKSTASNSLEIFNQDMFYTQDNDTPTGCASTNEGGWWFSPNSCGGTRGGILTSEYKLLQGWYSETLERPINYARTEMKIRQIGCSM